jgi:hypothetical protein
VRLARGHDHDVAGSDDPLGLAVGHRHLSLLDEEDLGVGVAVQARSGPRRRIDEEERDPHAVVVVSLELA